MLQDNLQIGSGLKSSGTLTTEGSVTLTESAVASQARTIRYASDEKVDEAMEKVFRWHSRLLAELAK